MGAIKIPDALPIKAARAKVALPAKIGEMPCKRAPILFTAVARRALPYSVRSKAMNKATMRKIETRITHRVWLFNMTAPKRKPVSEKGCVRAPSGPNNNKPTPTMVT